MCVVFAGGGRVEAIGLGGSIDSESGVDWCCRVTLLEAADILTCLLF